MLLLSAFLPAVFAQGVRLPPPLQLPPEIVLDEFRDVLKIDPVHYRAQMENEQVRVLRAKLGRDEAVPTHDCRSGVLVAITEIHIRLTRPDKRIQDIHMEAGDTRWISEDTHAQKNLSTEPAEFLFIEWKSGRPL